ncbi:MAG: hypothetical protein LBQ57_02610, partial [Spirochaetales bacterium]|nr:hypothetical protein [Spirochaetales bacterium]
APMVLPVMGGRVGRRQAFLFRREKNPCERTPPIPNKKRMLSAENTYGRKKYDKSRFQNKTIL